MWKTAACMAIHYLVKLPKASFKQKRERERTQFMQWSMQWVNRLRKRSRVNISWWFLCSCESCCSSRLMCKHNTNNMKHSERDGRWRGAVAVGDTQSRTSASREHPARTPVRVLDWILWIGCRIFSYFNRFLTLCNELWERVADESPVTMTTCWPCTSVCPRDDRCVPWETKSKHYLYVVEHCTACYETLNKKVE